MERRYVIHTPSPAARPVPGAERLNEQQRAVVEAPSGPMLVIAGAGTGKTETVTQRVARLIAHGTPPQRILLLTFTNRAARDMVGRAVEIVGPEGLGVHGGTFHSSGRRILREFGPAIGLPPDFSILDSEDAATLMRQCIERTGRNPEGTRFPKPSTLVELLSHSLNTGGDLGERLRTRYPQFLEHEEQILESIRLYATRKFELGVLDFDDLLSQWRRLLVEEGAVADEVRGRFDQILVDEYQDTNRLQAEVVDSMAREHRNVMVVGDDCQSIYSFRGAEFQNIIGFPERYPGCRRYLLETNYRSSPQILALANASIARNELQYAKRLRASQPDGPLPALVEAKAEDQASAFVAQRVLELRDEGVPLEEIAVLYRAHWHSMRLQIELAQRRIPFRVRSGARFFEQRHVKDVLAFLRFADNPRDELAFGRVAMMAEGIGPAKASQLFQAIASEGGGAKALESAAVARAVPARSRPVWSLLSGVLLELARGRANPAEAIDRVRSRFYDARVRATFDAPDNRLRELDTLATYAAQHASARAFLDGLSLVTTPSGEELLEAGQRDESMVLSSVHQAKGLEFRVVFVIWLSESYFPMDRAALSREEMEEERRLFYVAVSRAKRELYLVRVLIGYDRGNSPIVLRRSPFLRELAGEAPPLWEEWKLVPGAG